jgi:hypothetical protein
MDTHKSTRCKIHMPYCPEHPSNVQWFWKKSCEVCNNIEDIKSGGPLNTPERLAARTDPDSDPDHHYARRPRICVDSSSAEMLTRVIGRDAMAPILREISKRDRRRRKAGLKYPYTFPRRGSDTNTSSFTGRALSIQREGLSSIGRTVSGAKTCNSSGFPWKSI